MSGAWVKYLRSRIAIQGINPLKFEAHDVMNFSESKGHRKSMMWQREG